MTNEELFRTLKLGDRIRKRNGKTYCEESYGVIGPGDSGCLANDWAGKRKRYAEKFPEGYTLEWVDDIEARPDLMAIIEAANARHAAEESAALTKGADQ